MEPGERVPGENSLMDHYGVARETARKALDELAKAGLITKVRGSGTYVREERRLTRKPRRYRRQKQLGEFATDAMDAGRDPNVQASSVHVVATSKVAERLAIRAGDPVMKTEYLFLADGEPIQSSISYEPLELTGGTEVEFPEEGRYANAGVIPRMDAIGAHITHVTEEVTVRPPRAAEVNALRIESGVHVFCIRRTFRTDQRPVETADIIRLRSAPPGALPAPPGRRSCLRPAPPRSADARPCNSIPPTFGPARGEQPRPRASRSFVQWRAPP